MPIHHDARPHAHRARKRGPIATWLDQWAAQRFFKRLVKHTNNFDRVTWLGHPTWQNALDMCTIQQTIAELRPDAIIETGTNRGGSSLFYAHLMDLMGQGRILTIDIEKLHNLTHPRVSYIIASSTDPATLDKVRDWLGPNPGRVMVILDSDHSRAHVRQELELYAPLVTPGSYLLCQDGVIDTLPMFHRNGEQGPLLAIRDFLPSHPEFQVDEERCQRFLITHHPSGWLKRRDNR